MVLNQEDVMNLKCSLEDGYRVILTVVLNQDIE
jgi:hypothetical protein